MLPDDLFGPGSPVRVIGHRGAAAAVPENTVASFRHAVRVGADAVELDLHCSRDGHLVCIHDGTLERTTDGTGPVEARDLEELRTADAGFRFSPDGGRSFPFRGRGLRIPTLEEALEAAGELPVVVEVKSAAAGRALGSWLEERPSEAARMIVGGFDAAAVAPAAERARWRCATSDDLTPYVLLGKLGLGGLAAPSADAAMVPERRGLLRVVTRRFVRRCHTDGIGVHVWTVNRPDRMRRLLDLGVDGLVTDLPARARRVLEERAALP